MPLDPRSTVGPDHTLDLGCLTFYPLRGSRIEKKHRDMEEKKNVYLIREALQAPVLDPYKKEDEVTRIGNMENRHRMREKEHKVT